MSIPQAFHESFRGLCRTGTAGVMSVVATAASLLLLGVFVQIVAGGYVLAASVRERVEVEVYLRDGLSRRAALRIARAFEEMPKVAEARYIDKNAAAEEFREMFGTGLLEAVSGNPLPTSIRVRLKNKGDLTQSAREIADAISGRKEVEGVDVGESWLGSLERFLRIATAVGVLLGGVLCLACAFAVSNVTKLMVLGEREAILVMRLVGATGRYIRLTFLLGGCLIGGTGGVLAGVVLWMGAAWWTGWIPEIALLPFSQIVPLLILLGAVLGVLGSWTSLSRVLRAVTWR